jgi:outer membrane protein TolC
MKFSRKKIITVLLLIILNQFAVAEPIMIDKFEMNQQEQETFVNSLIYSIKEHPIFLQTLTILETSKASLDISKSSNKPQIQLQANSRNSLKQKFEDPLSALTESTKDEHRADSSLILQQSIFDKAIKEEINKQEYMVKADYFDKQQRISELTLEMALVCQDTAAYKIISDLIEISIDSHSEIVNRIQMRVESGRAAQAEMTRAKARLAEARAKRMTIELKLSTAKAKFQQLMSNGEPCEKFIKIDPEQIIIDTNKVQDAIENNFSVMRASELIKAAERELEKAKAGFRPKVNLELRGDRYDLTGDKNYDVYAGVNFNVDIYTGGKRTALIRLANEQLKTAQLNKEILIKDLRTKSGANLAELNNSNDRLKIFNTAYEAYMDSRDKLSLQFESSNVSLLELLQAERDFIESAELLLLNKKEIISSQIRQLYLLGKITDYFEKEL